MQLAAPEGSGPWFAPPHRSLSSNSSSECCAAVQGAGGLLHGAGSDVAAASDSTPPLTMQLSSRPPAAAVEQLRRWQQLHLHGGSMAAASASAASQSAEAPPGGAGEQQASPVQQVLLQPQGQQPAPAPSGLLQRVSVAIGALQHGITQRRLSGAVGADSSVPASSSRNVVAAAAGAGASSSWAGRSCAGNASSLSRLGRTASNCSSLGSGVAASSMQQVQLLDMIGRGTFARCAAAGPQECVACAAAHCMLAPLAC